MALFGPPDVEKLSKRRDVQGLIRALSYPKDPGVRRRAADALGWIGGLGFEGSRVVDGLAAGLADQDPQVRRRAASALSRIGGSRARDALATALGHGDIEVRRSAVDALGEAGDARAAEALAARLGDPDVHERRGAALFLGRMGDPRALDELAAFLADRASGSRMDAADALGRIGDARAVEALAGGLWDQDQDVSVQGRIRDALIQIGARAVGPLAAVLLDREADARSTVASILGRIGDAGAVDALVAALGDQDADVRRSATAALGEIGDPRALEALTGALRDKDAGVRQDATTALIQLHDPRAVHVLTAALGDEDVATRAWAADALGRTGDPGTANALAAALRDQDAHVRDEAAEALRELGDPRGYEAAPSPREMAISIRDLRAVRLGIVAEGEIGQDFVGDALFELMMRWNPRLTAALRDAATSASIDVYKGATLNAVLRHLDELQKEEYPECRLLLQNGSFRVRDPTTGREFDAMVVLAHYVATAERRRDVVTAAGQELELVPAT